MNIELLNYARESIEYCNSQIINYVRKSIEYCNSQIINITSCFEGDVIFDNEPSGHIVTHIVLYNRDGDNREVNINFIIMNGDSERTKLVFIKSCTEFGENLDKLYDYIYIGSIGEVEDINTNLITQYIIFSLLQ